MTDLVGAAVADHGEREAKLRAENTEWVMRRLQRDSHPTISANVQHLVLAAVLDHHFGLAAVTPYRIDLDRFVHDAGERHLETVVLWVNRGKFQSADRKITHTVGKTRRVADTEGWLA